MKWRHQRPGHQKPRGQKRESEVDAFNNGQILKTSSKGTMRW